MAGKRYAELVEVEEGIQERLDSGDAADPEYWAALLQRLKAPSSPESMFDIVADSGIAS